MVQYTLERAADGARVVPLHALRDASTGALSLVPANHAQALQLLFDTDGDVADVCTWRAPPMRVRDTSNGGRVVLETPNIEWELNACSKLLARGRVAQTTVIGDKDEVAALHLGAELRNGAPFLALVQLQIVAVDYEDKQQQQQQNVGLSLRSHDTTFRRRATPDYYSSGMTMRGGVRDASTITSDPNAPFDTSLFASVPNAALRYRPFVPLPRGDDNDNDAPEQPLEQRTNPLYRTSLFRPRDSSSSSTTARRARAPIRLLPLSTPTPTTIVAPTPSTAATASTTPPKRASPSIRLTAYEAIDKALTPVRNMILDHYAPLYRFLSAQNANVRAIKDAINTGNTAELKRQLAALRQAYGVLQAGGMSDTVAAQVDAHLDKARGDFGADNVEKWLRTELTRRRSIDLEIYDNAASIFEDISTLLKQYPDDDDSADANDTALRQTLRTDLEQFTTRIQTALTNQASFDAVLNLNTISDPQLSNTIRDTVNNNARVFDTIEESRASFADRAKSIGDDTVRAAMLAESDRAHQLLLQRAIVVERHIRQQRLENLKFRFDNDMAAITVQYIYAVHPTTLDANAKKLVDEMLDGLSRLDTLLKRFEGTAIESSSKDPEVTAVLRGDYATAIAEMRRKLEREMQLVREILPNRAQAQRKDDQEAREQADKLAREQAEQAEAKRKSDARAKLVADAKAIHAANLAAQQQPPARKSALDTTTAAASSPASSAAAAASPSGSVSPTPFTQAGAPTKADAAADARRIRDQINTARQKVERQSVLLLPTTVSSISQKVTRNTLDTPEKRKQAAAEIAKLKAPLDALFEAHTLADKLEKRIFELGKSTSVDFVRKPIADLRAALAQVDLGELDATLSKLNAPLVAKRIEVGELVAP